MSGRFGKLALDARGGQFSRTTPQSFGKLASQHRREKSEQERGATYQVFGLLKSGKRASKPSTEYGAGSRSRFTREEAERLKKRLEELNPGRKWEITGDAPEWLRSVGRAVNPMTRFRQEREAKQSRLRAQYEYLERVKRQRAEQAAQTAQKKQTARSEMVRSPGKSLLQRLNPMTRFREEEEARQHRLRAVSEQHQRDLAQRDKQFRDQMGQFAAGPLKGMMQRGEKNR